MKIVYTSNAGHTAEYAKMLSERLNIPYYSEGKIKGNVDNSDEIIYMGWVFANKIMGYEKFKDGYNIRCVIAVGITPPSDRNKDVLITTNNIEYPFFYLRGGIDLTKISFIKRLMLKLVAKRLEKESKLENEKLIETLKHGGDYVSSNRMNEIFKYIEK